MWICDVQYRYHQLTGQSHLIFGTGSTGSVTICPLSKLCYANANYKPLENLDAIALHQLEDAIDNPLRDR